MTLFRDLRRLNRQASKLREQYPVDVQLADAAAKLAEATSTMEAMTASRERAAHVLANGVDAIATVTAARQRPTMINHQPVVELELVVTMPSGAPVPVRRTEVVRLLDLPRAQVGVRLAVRVDPGDPSAIWIDWGATPSS